MDRGLVKETASHIYIAGPNWVFQLAPVHLDVRGMRFVSRYQLLQTDIHRSETTVVADLENTIAASCCFPKLPCIIDADRKWFLTECVLSGCECMRGDFCMRLIWRTHEN